MARYNEILVGRFNRALTKLFSMKGEAPAPQLSSDVQAGFVFPLGAEFRYLESWDRFCVQHSFAASLGNTNAYRLRNPAASNAVMVVEKILTCAVTALDTLIVDSLATAIDFTLDNVSIVRLDSRTQRQSAMQASSTQAVGPVGNAILLLRQGADTTFDVLSDTQHEIPVLPGSAIQVRSSTANQASLVSFMWRERQLEESERT